MNNNFLPEVEPKFYWFSSACDIPVYEIEGKLYALHGWNGEVYTSCWKCVDSFTSVGGKDYTARPVYRYQEENIDLDELDEDSDEFDEALQVARFEVWW